jgi:flagellin
MRINHNIPGTIAYWNFNKVNNLLQQSIERLSSGLRINHAADDPGGLALAQTLQMYLSSYESNLDNVQNGISMLQTADSTIDTLNTIVGRIRDLTELAANGDKTDEDRAMYQTEVDSLMDEYNRIVNTTQYNGKNLIDGSLGISAQIIGDVNNISQSNSVSVNPSQIVEKGQYDVEVERVAEKSTGYLQGNSGATSVDTTSSLYDFLGASADGTLNLNITVDNKTVNVTADVKSGAGDTVGDLINKINDAFSDNSIQATASFGGADIQPNVADNQPGISITSDKYGSSHSVSLEVLYNDTGGTATAINSTPTLSTSTVLNDNDTSSNIYGDLNISLGSFKIQDKSGATATINVAAGDTIGDLVNNINTAGIGVSAVFNQSAGRLEITDTSGGTGTLKITENGSYTAGDLGIVGDETNGQIIGQSLSRTRDFVLNVTSPSSTTATILGNYVNGSENFSALKDVNLAVVDSGTVIDGKTISGGISGVAFALQDNGITAGDKFSLQVEGNPLDLEVSAAGGDSARFPISISSLALSEIGLLDSSGNYDISSQASAQNLLDNGNPDTAISNISAVRSKIGAYQNGLTYLSDVLTNTISNLTSAESNIMDTDYAKETLNFTNYQLLQQSSIYMLNQANLIQGNVLDLLQPFSSSS